MAIFLDSSKSEEIEKYHRMGIIRGVTTNPSILLKDASSIKHTSLKIEIVEIADLISPYPLSVEVTSNKKDEMISQAIMFGGWSSNINVKIPIHGPNGETLNLEVIHELECEHNIKINVTAMMNAQQCILAALAGASYVSIFGGRINNMGYNCCEEIKKARTIIDKKGFKSKIIVGSCREVLNIVEWLEAGADIVTVSPDLLSGMIKHPYSSLTVNQFITDAERLSAMRRDYQKTFEKEEKEIK